MAASVSRRVDRGLRRRQQGADQDRRPRDPRGAVRRPGPGRVPRRRAGTQRLRAEELRRQLGDRRPRDHPDQGRLRRHAGRRDREGQEAHRAGQRRHPHRTPLGRRGPRDQGLRQDRAGQDVRQRLVGGPGHHLPRSRPELLPLLDRRRPVAWPASASTPSTTKGYKNVALVAEDYSFPYTQVGGFMYEFCAAGGHVVQKNWVPLGTKDYSSVVSNLPTSGIDAIYVALGGSDAVNFFTQYNQAGGKAKFIGGSITVDQSVLATEGCVPGHPGRDHRGGPDRRHGDRAGVAGLRRRNTRRPSPTACRTRACSPSATTTRPTASSWPSRRSTVTSATARRSSWRRSPRRPSTGRPATSASTRNRQAIGPNYVTEVQKAADGSLSNNVISEGRERRPDPRARVRTARTSPSRSAATSLPAHDPRLRPKRSSPPCDCRAWGGASAPSRPSAMSRWMSPSASAGRSSVPTGPARRRSSTSSPATTCPPPGRSSCSGPT